MQMVSSFVRIHVFAYIYLCMFFHMHACVCVDIIIFSCHFIHKCTCIHGSLVVYSYVYVYIYICIPVDMCRHGVSMYECMYICMYTSVDVYSYSCAGVSVHMPFPCMHRQTYVHVVFCKNI